MNRADKKLYAQMGVSAFVLLLCAPIIVSSWWSGVPNDYTKWAFGMVGVIVGYWLK